MKKNLPIAILLFLSSCILLKKTQEFPVYTIAFYNVENLFDTKDDPLKNDNEYLPTAEKQWNEEKYNNKLKNLADVIAELGDRDGPEILGVCEVENHQVLNDLVNQKKLKSRHYGIVHHESPDERGIDVALLYKKNAFVVLESKAHTLELGGNDKTRDILQVKGILSEKDTLYIFVNHWPSRRGGAQESEAKRIAAATLLRTEIDKILLRNFKSKIIVMGDLNDDPTDASLRALKLNPEKSSVKSDELYNPFAKKHDPAKRGSLMYRGKWNLFDQILISKELIEQEGALQLEDADIFKEDYLLQQEGEYKGYPNRTFGGKKYLNGYSDHLPTYIQLKYD